MYIGEGLRYIGEGAFRECTSLQHIEIPEFVTLIHDEAFDACINCSELTTMELGEGLEWLGVEAFYECTSLDTSSSPPPSR